MRILLLRLVDLLLVYLLLVDLLLVFGLVAHVLQLAEELVSILKHRMRLLQRLSLVQLLVVLVAHVLQLADELATGGPVVFQPFLNMIVVV